MTHLRLTGLVLAAAALGACQLAFPFRDYDDGVLDGAAAPPPPVDGGSSDAASVDADADADAGPLDAAAPFALASGQLQPAEIVVDDTFVYWVDYGVDSGVYRIQKDGGDRGVVATVAPHQDYPVDLVVDDAGVYWVTQSSSGLPNSAPDAGTVMRATKDGSALPTALVTQVPFPNRIAQDDTTLYYTSALAQTGGIFSVPKAGGEPTVLASNVDAPGGIGVNGTSVYFTVEGSDDTLTTDAVVAIPKAGCDGGAGCANRLATPTNPFELRIDDTYIYWGSRWGMGDRTALVSRRPLAGEGEVDWPTTIPCERVGLAVAGGQLFISEGASLDAGSVGELPTSFDGGNAWHLVAADQGKPQGIVADDVAVYWTDYATGLIMRASR